MIDNFLEFEKYNSLFDNEIQGVKYWHFIRVRLYNEIRSKYNKVGQAHSSSRDMSILKLFLLLIKKIPNIILKNPKSLKDKDILILNSPRRVKKGSFYEDMYTDEIIRNLSCSYAVIENPYLDDHMRPTPKTNIKYADGIRNKYFLKRLFYRITSKKILSDQDVLSIQELITQINNDFVVDLDINRWIKTISDLIIYYHTYHKYYENILKKVKPKVIIEVVSYGASKLVMNGIANNKGIPTIELQHGTMGKYHIAYNFLDKFDLSSFPDYVFVFGQYWKNVTRLPVENENVKVVGWPYFENRLNNHSNKTKSGNSLKTTILFISQGTTGKELSKIAVEISNNLDSGKYRFIYKLHPGEYDRWKSQYPWLIGSNLEVIDNNDEDMHYYFSQSTIQIGVNSTALFEGLGYGLTTYIVKLNGHEYMEYLYSNGHAYLADGAQSVINDIANRENFENRSNIDYFWQNDSINKVLEEIGNIINENM